MTPRSPPWVTWFPGEAGGAMERAWVSELVILGEHFSSPRLNFPFH